MNINNHNWGEYRSGHECDYYLPSSINKAWRWEDSGLDVLIEQATLKLGELNGYASLIPDVETITTLHRITEALSSCRITSNSISLKEILLPEHTIDPQFQSDRALVDNYFNTLSNDITNLNQEPLSLESIRKTHHSLYKGLNHNLYPDTVEPGSFRNSFLNTTSDYNSTRTFGASYTPPDPIHIRPLMHDLDLFIQNRDNHPIPELIRTALIYYQLISIRPFSIGNGKIARLVTYLYMIQIRLLSRPILNLSKYFENNRSQHDKLLNSVQEDHDMINWIKFFLNGVKITATDSISRLAEVYYQKKDLSYWIETEWGRRSGTGLILLNTIYSQPMIDVKGVEKACDLTPKAAGDLVRSFIDAGILTEITGQVRNRIFLFEPYLNKFTS
tara:strand:- start:53532 stop:54695 length:1164 start_codon:yes stop_codon:yes gene_type:complete